MKRKAWTEIVMQVIFFVAACASVLAVALICIFLFANGIPAMKEIGFVKFLTGTLWKPKNEIFGIFPMIVGSLICYGRSDHYRCPDWNLNSSIYGVLLPGKNL